MRVIAGKARRLLLKTVPGNSTRPTTDKSKETLFNMMQAGVPGSYFLDLFAGSGAIGIEALSRGAYRAVFVESDRRACGCIRENLAHTRMEAEGLLLPYDVMRSLRILEERDPFSQRSKEKVKEQDSDLSLPESKKEIEEETKHKAFDIIFMDPPYDMGLEKTVLTFLAASPLADEDTLIVVEASLKTDFSWLEELGYHVVKTREYKSNRHLFLRKG